MFRIHIYQSFDETKFKAPAFVASFFASVYCYDKVSSQIADNAQTNIAIGSAVLLYGISLVSEVWMLLNHKEKFIEKLFKGIVFWDGVVAIALGINLINSENSIIPAKCTIMVCAIAAAIFFVDGLLYFWVRPPETHLNTREENLKKMDIGGPNK